MDCLIDVIGLAGCGGTTPVSGLFVNSLPGMSLKKLEEISDQEQVTYAGVWEDVQLRASKRVAMAVYTALASRYKLSTITQTVDLGKLVDASTTTANADEGRGLFFDLDSNISGTDFVNSALQVHYIQKASFYSTGSVTGAVFKIYNKDTETVLDTFTQNLTAGWNDIQINTSYSARRLVLSVNCATITTVTTEVKNLCGVCGCNAEIKGGSFVTSSGVGSWSESDNSHGLSVVYSVRCKYDPLVCNNLELFSIPMWYACGSEICMEAMYSDRFTFSTLNRKENEELKLYYDTQFNEAIKQAIDGINLSLSDCCIDCDPQYSVREASL